MTFETVAPLSLENISINSWLHANFGHSRAFTTWLLPPAARTTPPAFLAYRDEVVQFMKVYVLRRELDLRDEDRALCHFMVLGKNGPGNYFLDVKASLDRLKWLVGGDMFTPENKFIHCVLFGMIEEAELEWIRQFQGREGYVREFRERWRGLDVLLVFIHKFSGCPKFVLDLPKTATTAAKYCLYDLFLWCYRKMSKQQKRAVMHKWIMTALISKASRILNIIWEDAELRMQFDEQQFNIQLRLVTTTDWSDNGLYGTYFIEDLIYNILTMRDRTPFAALSARLIAERLLAADAKIANALQKRRLSKKEKEYVDEEAIEIFGIFRRLGPLDTHGLRQFLHEPFPLY